MHYYLQERQMFRARTQETEYGYPHSANASSFQVRSVEDCTIGYIKPKFSLNYFRGASYEAFLRGHVAVLLTPCVSRGRNTSINFIAPVLFFETDGRRIIIEPEKLQKILKLVP